jgi:hypothetical protein
VLSELLRLLEAEGGEMDLQELSRRLGAQPGAVAGMLDLLARKGRLVAAGAACGPCQGCRLAAQCTLGGQAGVRGWAHLR